MQENEQQEEDSEMTEDVVDWYDFVVVEQIELYDDKEMTEQLTAQQLNAAAAEERDAKRSAQIQAQVKLHMAENEELKSMPDPSLLGAHKNADEDKDDGEEADGKDVED